MLGAGAVLIEDVIASVSNGAAGRNMISAEERVRKLEGRLTGRSGRPPVSPRDLNPRFAGLPGAARETTTDSTQPPGPPATRCEIDSSTLSWKDVRTHANISNRHACALLHTPNRDLVDHCKCILSLATLF